MSSMTGSFVSARRASSELGVTMSTLRKWRYVGIGPTPVHVTKSHVVYDAAEILALRENGGVRGVMAAIAKKRASLPARPTIGRTRAAVASRAASEARRARREAREAKP